MKTSLHLSFLRIASLFIAFSCFCFCAKIEEETIQPSNRQNDVEPEAADRGVNYLGRTFYLNSYDRIAATATRADATDRTLSRSFSIVSETTGSSYLGVHVMAAYLDKNQTLQNIGVIVNDEYVGDLDVKKGEWDFVSIKNGKTINLTSGLNVITFTSSPPYYPEIDAVQTESDPKNLMKEDPQYNVYLSQLSVRRASSMEKLDQEAIDSEESLQNIETRSAWDASYDWQVSPQVMSNPDGNYKHMVKVPVTYTYHRKLSLAKGNYTFMTGPIAGDSYNSVDPVMYLYKIDDPHNYSYYKDDYSGMGFHPRIDASLPAGDYYLVIRAYSGFYASTTTGRQGLVNVYQNGALLNTQTPVGGYSVDVDSPNTGTINYFTAYSSGIPDFFLEEKGSNKVKFFGETNFYTSQMEHMWWYDARMRLIKPSSNDRYRMIISCVGAFGAYYGNCDVYGSCQQVPTGSDITRAFPNLKADDGIYSSASQTTIYNCASWAGGLTYGWTWGGIYANGFTSSLVGPNYGGAYVWDSWDAFFANNPQRYVGATVYTRDGANSSNGEIAVWSNNGAISGVTHFSVRGTANGHPHGYAWESKPGGLRRIFHPRDALRGTSYGNIFAYYRDASKNQYGNYNRTRSGHVQSDNISLEESLKRGLTVIEDVELTPRQKMLFSSGAKTRSGRSFDTSEIKKRWERWTNRISQSDMAIISDPNVLIHNPEGVDFINYCSQNKQNALAFFVDLYFNKSDDGIAKQVSSFMFCDIFSDYAAVIERIKANWKNNPFNANGAYIAPTPEMFLKKYAKELIDELY